MNCDIEHKCISMHKNDNCQGSPFNYTTYCFVPAETNNPPNAVSNGVSNKSTAASLDSLTTNQLQNKSLRLKNQVITRQKLALVLLKQLNARYGEISELQNLNIEINKVLISRITENK